MDLGLSPTRVRGVLLYESRLPQFFFFNPGGLGSRDFGGLPESRTHIHTTKIMGGSKLDKVVVSPRFKVVGAVNSTAPTPGLNFFPNLQQKNLHYCILSNFHNRTCGANRRTMIGLNTHALPRSQTKEKKHTHIRT
jgi:hypothetical protein